MAPKTNTYSVHPSIVYVNSIIERMPQTTGRTLDEWVGIVRKEKLPDARAQREWLKSSHKLGGTTASMIADAAAGLNDEDIDPKAYLKAAAGYVEAMYDGAKAGLRPIHDALINLALSWPEKIRICPCKTIVPFYRNHVIAQIKPSTRTRIDFGLALKGAKQMPPARVKETGGLKTGDRITHAIALTDKKEVDSELRKWLEIAWDLDG